MKRNACCILSSQISRGGNSGMCCKALACGSRCTCVSLSKLMGTRAAGHRGRGWGEHGCYGPAGLLRHNIGDSQRAASQRTVVRRGSLARTASTGTHCTHDACNACKLRQTEPLNGNRLCRGAMSSFSSKIAPRGRQVVSLTRLPSILTNSL